MSFTSLNDSLSGPWTPKKLWPNILVAGQGTVCAAPAMINGTFLASELGGCILSTSDPSVSKVQLQRFYQQCFSLCLAFFITASCQARSCISLTSQGRYLPPLPSPSRHSEAWNLDVLWGARERSNNLVTILWADTLALHTKQAGIYRWHRRYLKDNIWHYKFLNYVDFKLILYTYTLVVCSIRITKCGTGTFEIPSIQYMPVFL